MSNTIQNREQLCLKCHLPPKTDCNELHELVSSDKTICMYKYVGMFGM